MELEHPAMTGIQIDDEIAVRKLPCQIVGVLGWNHAIIVAVGDEDPVANLRQIR